MADFTVRVTINAAALGELTSTPEAQHLVDACAQRALEFQQAVVPVDTGALRANLAIDAPTPQTRRIGILGVRPPLKDVTQYALPVEEGHRTRSGTWVQAQPYIRPSIDAAKKGLTNG